ncbi:Uncharacterised protein [Leclercia adecarboxylata]|uniref:Uncharacterized protein n=1 Tax=Leclercia adecarboxylata TaxID=83655 RepID=A0A4U9HF77_9ENTR|nr:Uncharacterised protein [Leclercia adecarboxylata]
MANTPSIFGLAASREGHHLQPTVTAAFGVLVPGEHFNIRVALEFSLATFHAVFGPQRLAVR